MALSNHTAEDGRVWSRLVIDLTLSVVNTSDEEGGLSVVRGKDVKEVAGVEVWSIIVGESDLALGVTDIDVGSIWDGTLVVTDNTRGVCAGRGGISIAAAKVEKTVRRLAVNCSRSTPA